MDNHAVVHSVKQEECFRAVKAKPQFRMKILHLMNPVLSNTTPCQVEWS